MKEIKTDEFHWVVTEFKDLNVSFMLIKLADKNNIILSTPELRNLSKKEQQLIEKLGLFSLYKLPDKSFVMIYDPKFHKNNITITAPLYTPGHNQNGIIYHKTEGVYTKTYATPKDFQTICEFVVANIPSEKIKDHGYYVDMKNIKNQFTE